ncbi:NADPH:quinone oxidoreductase family protein [Bradyrhizobium elkanii]|uniref:NADPH:quinone oxidoreductase family protein n=1 Tax=Bradyrhizobium elkanii TaxID=29448 RepID=UPI0004B4C708|nr:NADPH:quinone oxidoreductase family protein [Bradyrhizobium elkanii]WLA83277.1 NADPH:quinone oxidoreductase family protein [Bradyrhizobium elkanii]
MRAVICKEFGPVDNLVVGQVERREIGPKQLRIAIHVASLGFMDILMARGQYQLKPPLPYIPGSCGAGVVTEVGGDVVAFKVGDRVSFLNYFSAYAEEIVTDAITAIRIPDSMDFEQAATYRLTYSPSWYALVDRAGLKPGETLVITGAAGGVGMAAVRLGKLLGARVIAAVGSEKKAEAVRANGADEVIDYSVDNFRDKVKEYTNGRGADVILDVVGGDIFDQCIRCVNIWGRIIVMGFASGRIPTLPMNLPMLKNASIVGAFFGGWGMGKDHEGIRVLNAKLLELAAAGQIKAHVSHRFPLDQIKTAMHTLLGREAIGKIILNTR